MSASEDNTSQQRRRHRGPLVGMALVVAFALAYLVWWLMHEAARSDAPQGTATQVDGRTGEQVDTPPESPAPETPVEVPPAQPAPEVPSPTPSPDAPPAPLEDPAPAPETPAPVTPTPEIPQPGATAPSGG